MEDCINDFPQWKINQLRGAYCQTKAAKKRLSVELFSKMSAKTRVWSTQFPWSWPNNSRAICAVLCHVAKSTTIGWSSGFGNMNFCTMGLSQVHVPNHFKVSCQVNSTVTINNDGDQFKNGIQCLTEQACSQATHDSTVPHFSTMQSSSPLAFAHFELSWDCKKSHWSHSPGMQEWTTSQKVRWFIPITTGPNKYITTVPIHMWCQMNPMVKSSDIQDCPQEESQWCSAVLPIMRGEPQIGTIRFQV